MASAHKLYEVSFSPQPPSISSSQDFTVYQSGKGTWHLSHSRLFPLPARPHRGGRFCIQNAWDQKCFRVWSFQKIFLVGGGIGIYRDFTGWTFLTQHPESNNAPNLELGEGAVVPDRVKCAQSLSLSTAEQMHSRAGVNEHRAPGWVGTP